MAAVHCLAKLASDRYTDRQGWIAAPALLVLLCTLLLISGCGFQRQSTLQLPERLRTLSLQSDDPYGHLARAIGDQLRYHRFMLLDEQTDTQANAQGSDHHVRLQLLNAHESRVALSVFPDGKGAQYQITYRVSAQLHLAESSTSLKPVPLRTMPFQVVVSHTFFDNPAAALAKDSEQETIRQQLYQHAATQLVLKLLVMLTREAHTAIAQPTAATFYDHATHSA